VSCKRRWQCSWLTSRQMSRLCRTRRRSVCECVAGRCWWVSQCDIVIPSVHLNWNLFQKTPTCHEYWNPV